YFAIFGGVAFLYLIGIATALTMGHKRDQNAACVYPAFALFLSLARLRDMNNSWTAALPAIMLLGLVVFMAPNILALNRGKVLRNIAIWLAIFAGLGLAYQFFGPGGSMKLPF